MREEDWRRFRRLLPTEDEKPLSAFETQEVLRAIFEERLDLKWVELLLKRGCFSDALLGMAIAFDYPLDLFMVKGKRITGEMLMSTLDGEEFFHALESLLKLGGNASFNRNALIKKAAERWNYLAVQVLVEYGANPAAVSKRTISTLQAVACGDANAAATLLELGVKIRLPNRP